MADPGADIWLRKTSKVYASTGKGVKQAGLSKGSRRPCRRVPRLAGRMMSGVVRPPLIADGQGRLRKGGSVGLGCPTSSFLSFEELYHILI